MSEELNKAEPQKPREPSYPEDCLLPDEKQRTIDALKAIGKEGFLITNYSEDPEPDYYFEIIRGTINGVEVEYIRRPEEQQRLVVGGVQVNELIFEFLDKYRTVAYDLNKEKAFLREKEQTEENEHELARAREILF